MKQEKIVAIAEQNGWYVYFPEGGRKDKVLLEFSRFTRMDRILISRPK